MTNEQLAALMIELLGGGGNIEKAANCMTRLRTTVKNPALVKVDTIKETPGVLGLVESGDNIQVILGPGKAQKVADICRGLLAKTEGAETTAENAENSPKTEGDANWQDHKARIKEKQKSSFFKNATRSLSEIFVPLIPGIIAAGILSGLGNLIQSFMEQGTLPDQGPWLMIRLMFGLIGSGLLSYLAIYTGINAAKQFGATEVLGGMIGAMSITASIAEIAVSLGLYNEAVPMESILTVGKGGVIGVVFGVWILAKIEKAVRKRMPNTLDLIATPLISILLTTIIFVLVIMPVAGFASDWLVAGLSLMINSTNPIVSIVCGYILAAIFLPMVLFGLHHGLIPIYTLQLQKMAGISLFPVLTSAGGGQVGAALAIYLKARKKGDKRLQETILGALPAGILGVGEPLIYGVTLPLFKPFITAGLGAGFGGAYIMYTHVLANAWEPSGLPGVIVMQPASMLNYLIGLLIAYIGGFVITYIFVGEKDL